MKREWGELVTEENLEVDVAEEHGKGHWKVPLRSQGYVTIASLIDNILSYEKCVGSDGAGKDSNVFQKRTIKEIVCTCRSSKGRILCPNSFPLSS